MRRATHSPLTAAAVLCLLAAPALAALADLPAGWFKAGSHPAEYEMGLDESVRRPGGKSSATVKGIASKMSGFGTLMQTSQPGQYAGQTHSPVGMGQIGEGDRLGWPLVTHRRESELRSRLRQHAGTPYQGHDGLDPLRDRARRAIQTPRGSPSASCSLAADRSGWTTCSSKSSRPR